jgi:hypothetical protein
MRELSSREDIKAASTPPIDAELAATPAGASRVLTWRAMDATVG